MLIRAAQHGTNAAHHLNRCRDFARWRWCGTIVPAVRPHRLEDQDAALSRLKQGFESPWGHIVYPLLWVWKSIVYPAFDAFTRLDLDV